MEDISPTLKCLIEMQSSLQNGEPVRAGLVRFVQSGSGEFSNEVRRFLFDWDQGRDWRPSVSKIRSANRRALLELASCGMSGQSVQAHLAELRIEIQAACESEIKQHVEMLPLHMLFPLLLFLFPSYLLLLFGPLVTHFLKEIAR